MKKSNDVKEIIAEALHVSPDCITDNLGIGGIPQWDSMGNMAVIAALEEQLDIEFPIEDLFELTSVSSIIEEINRLS